MAIYKDWRPPQALTHQRLAAPPLRYLRGAPRGCHISAHEQKRCLPMVTISGRDQIHLLVAVAGLK